jgi:methylase of polypeptide subunit release factors
MVQTFSNFIEFLQKNHIFEKLTQRYDLTNESDLILIKKVREHIFSIKESSNHTTINFYEGIVKIFLKNTPLKERKILGEIYTPFTIVNEILEAIEYKSSNYIKNKSIIDISCGAGSFIVKCGQELRDCLLGKEKNISNYEVEELEKFIEKLKKNIFGIDINPIACLLCQLNLYFLTFDILEEIFQKKPNYIIPQFNIQNINTIALFLKNNPEKLQIEEFDIVVGNPPYLFIRDIPKNDQNLLKTSKLTTNVGQYDYYQIFIEMGLELLKEGGFLGYIIPDSLLALSNRKSIRKFIYDKSKIKEIKLVGDQFKKVTVSNIIIILEKSSKKSHIDNNIIKISEKSSEGYEIKQISQKYIKDWGYNFLVHLNKKDINLLNYLNSNFLKLNYLIDGNGNQIRLNRGIELGKTGMVVFCEYCKNFQPVPKGKKKKCENCGKLISQNEIEKIIFDERPNNSLENYKKFIYSMERYRIKKIKYIKYNLKGINYKDFDLYKDRIIIRQICQDNLICATYYAGEALSSQSFYNLKIIKSKNDEFDSYFLLGLLNSDLLSYYFFKSFGSYKNLFPRILIEKLKTLPIIIPKSAKEKEIAKSLSEEVRDIIRNYTIHNEDLYLQEEKISEYVFELYNIPMIERKFIESTLKDIKKSN